MIENGWLVLVYVLLCAGSNERPLQLVQLTGTQRSAEPVSMSIVSPCAGVPMSTGP